MSEGTEVVDQVIVLPRYTSFVGAGPFFTGAVNVRPYGSGIFAFMQVAGLGSPVAVAAATVQGSPDLEIWDDIGSPLATGDTDTRAFPYEWIRLKVALTGGVLGATCWCVVDLVRRET